MRLALDYDGTYTAAPELWDAFVLNARKQGHEVYLVTMRAPNETVRLGCHVDRIVYTDRKAKLPYLQLQGIDIQIWIDDRPDFILRSATPSSVEEAAKSGLWESPNSVSVEQVVTALKDFVVATKEIRQWAKGYVGDDPTFKCSGPWPQNWIVEKECNKLREVYENHEEVLETILGSGQTFF